MKGILIFIVLFAASVIALITNYQEIGQWYLDKVIVEEGGPYPNATFDKIKQDHPDDFKSKFESDLSARITLCKFADWVNSKLFFSKTAAQTLTMYQDSGLAQEDGFGDLVFKLAAYYQEENMYHEAFDTYKIFMDSYPNNSNIPEAKRSSEYLKFKYSLG
jgi:hypothetical protein